MLKLKDSCKISLILLENAFTIGHDNTTNKAAKTTMNSLHISVINHFWPKSLRGTAGSEQLPQVPDPTRPGKEKTKQPSSFWCLWVSCSDPQLRWKNLLIMCWSHKVTKLQRSKEYEYFQMIWWNCTTCVSTIRFDYFKLKLWCFHMQ